MQNFRGVMASQQGMGGEPFVVTINVDDEWARFFAGPKRMGAWRLADLRTERMTVFRFKMHLDSAEYVFVPDDPAGFSEAMGAVIDLRPKARFGLGERVKAAKAALAAERASTSLD